MDNIEFVTVEERKEKYGTAVIRNVKLKVDIQLGDTVYKDAVITIPESSLQLIIWKYETSYGFGGRSI